MVRISLEKRCLDGALEVAGVCEDAAGEEEDEEEQDKGEVGAQHALALLKMKIISFYKIRMK